MGEELSLKDVLDAINKQSADLKKEITDFKQEMLTSIGATVSEHTAKINNIEKQIEEIDEKVLKSEIEKRKNNMIFYKIAEVEASQDALHKAMVKMLNEEVQNTFEIRDIDFMFRLGKKREGQIRPVLVRFISYLKKELIMNNRKKLSEKSIDVADDLPNEIRERRKISAPLVKSLKEKGFHASLKMDKIKVNGEIWSVEKAREAVTEPNLVEEEGSSNGKRNRSPQSDFSEMKNQNRKMRPPPLKLVKNPASGTPITSYFSSPRTSAPRSPIIIVKTPSKNVQHVEIIDNK